MAHIYLGKAYEDSAQDDAQLEKARTELLKASEVEPNYFRTWQNLGAYYQNRANFSEMARYHQKAVELPPNEPNLHSNLGDTYVDLGNFPAAAVEYRLSLDQEKTLTAEYDLGGEPNRLSLMSPYPVRSFREEIWCRVLVVGARENERSGPGGRPHGQRCGSHSEGHRTQEPRLRSCPEGRGAEGRLPVSLQWRGPGGTSPRHAADSRKGGGCSSGSRKTTPAATHPQERLKPAQGPKPSSPDARCARRV